MQGCTGELQQLGKLGALKVASHFAEEDTDSERGSDRSKITK